MPWALSWASNSANDIVVGRCMALTNEAAIGVAGSFSCHSRTATPWTVWVAFA